MNSLIESTTTLVPIHKIKDLTILVGNDFLESLASIIAVSSDDFHYLFVLNGIDARIADWFQTLIIMVLL